MWLLTRMVTPPFGLQLLQQQSHVPDTLRVQTIGWFVQQQQVRVPQKGQRQPQAAALPHGKPFGSFFAHLFQAHLGQHPVHGGFLIVQAQQFCFQQAVVPGRQRSIQAGILNENAHPAAEVALCQRLTENLDLPGGGVGQSRQHLEGGGFTGAIGTDKTIDFPLRHLHVQMVHGSFAAVGLAQAQGSHSGLHLILSFVWYGFILKGKDQTIAKEI